MPADQGQPPAVGIGGTLAHEALVTALAQFLPALLKGLSFVGKSIPLGSDRTIDLLGVDRAGNPVLVLAATDGDEASLLEVLDVAAWLERSEVLLRRLLPGSTDDGWARAKLFFVAADFTHRSLRMVDLLRRERIELVRCRRISVGRDSAGLFENLTTGETTAAPQLDAAVAPERPEAPDRADLTREELEELSRPLSLSDPEGTQVLSGPEGEASPGV